MRTVIRFSDHVSIYARASAVGKTERDGPLGALFDYHDPTDRFGADTWEQSEESLSRTVLDLALSRACERPDQIDLLFAGDTLFAGSCGRTDLPGGSWEQMRGSLCRLAALEGDYTVYPGHGEPTTLWAERGTNPYLRMALEQRENREVEVT